MVSACSHGEHPWDLAMAAALRGGGTFQLAPPQQPKQQQQPPPVEWRSLEVRAGLPPHPAAAASTLLPLPAGAGGSGGGLELFDPTDKACLLRLEQLMSRKPKVGPEG